MQVERTSLLLVDQISFSSLTPRLGDRSPYIDHWYLEHQLHRLDEFIQAIVPLATRAGAALGRGAAKARTAAAPALRRASQWTRKAGSDALAKGRNVASRAKAGYQRVKQVAGDVQKFRKSNVGHAAERQVKDLAKRDTLSGDGDQATKPPVAPVSPPAHDGKPKFDTATTGDKAEPSPDVPGGDEKAVAKAGSEAPSTQGGAGPDPKPPSGGSDRGPRGAVIAKVGDQCPSGRNKTSVDGSQEGTKRCNDQTPGRAH